MGVQDPGGGTPLRNYYSVLDWQEEPKRKMGKRNRNFSSISVEKNDEEKFLIMESTTEGKTLSKVNPFLLSKVIENAINGKPLQVNRLKDGKLLIKVSNQKQADRIKKVEKISDTKGPMHVKISEHPTLNTCKGIIRSPDIEFMDKEEILEGLKTKKSVK